MHTKKCQHAYTNIITEIQCQDG